MKKIKLIKSLSLKIGLALLIYGCSQQIVTKTSSPPIVNTEKEAKPVTDSKPTSEPKVIEVPKILTESLVSKKITIDGIYPRIKMNKDKNDSFLLFYLVQEGDNLFKLYAQKFNRKLEKQGSEIFIGKSNTRLYEVELNSKGSFVITWRNNNSIFLKKYDKDNNQIGQEIKVVEKPVTDPLPEDLILGDFKVSINDNDETMVMWTENIKNTVQLNGMLYNSSLVDSKPFKIKDYTYRTADQTGMPLVNGCLPLKGNIVTDKNNDFNFVWNYCEINSNKYSKSSLEKETILEKPFASANSFTSRNSKGDIILSWVDNHFSIGVRLLNADKTYKYESRAYDGINQFPALIYDSVIDINDNKNFVVVWRELGFGGLEKPETMYLRMFDSKGNDTGKKIELEKSITFSQEAVLGNNKVIAYYDHTIYYDVAMDNNDGLLLTWYKLTKEKNNKINLLYAKNLSELEQILKN